MFKGRWNIGLEKWLIHGYFCWQFTFFLTDSTNELDHKFFYRVDKQWRRDFMIQFWTKEIGMTMKQKKWWKKSKLGVRSNSQNLIELSFSEEIIFLKSEIFFTNNFYTQFSMIYERIKRNKNLNLLETFSWKYYLNMKKNN
jgi:hypothetical protein